MGVQSDAQGLVVFAFGGRGSEFDAIRSDSDMFSGYSKSVLKLSDTKSAFLVHPKSNREEAAAIAYAVQQCCAKVSRSGSVWFGLVR